MPFLIVSISLSEYLNFPNQVLDAVVLMPKLTHHSLFALFAAEFSLRADLAKVLNQR